MADADDVVTKYFNEHSAKPLQTPPADPCADALFYKSCRQDLAEVASQPAHDLTPPPPTPHYYMLVMALFLVVGAAVWHRRASIGMATQRWLLRPLARKGARSAGRFKAWWLED